MALPYPIADIIQWARISQFLASKDIASGTLWGSRLDPRFATVLYTERRFIEKIYVNDPNYTGLREAADYLYALCGRYVFLAQTLSGGGQIVTPTGYTPFIYLIPIKSADFADATHYNDPRIVGKNLEIFWNNVNRYLNPPAYIPAEFVNTSLGVNILIEGFDAVANTDYELKIYIKNPY